MNEPLIYVLKALGRAGLLRGKPEFSFRPKKKSPFRYIQEGEIKKGTESVTLKFRAGDIKLEVFSFQITVEAMRLPEPA